MLGKCPKMEERFIAVRLMGRRDGGAGSWSPFKKKKGVFLVKNQDFFAPNGAPSSSYLPQSGGGGVGKNPTPKTPQIWVSALSA